MKYLAMKHGKEIAVVSAKDVTEAFNIAREFDSEAVAVPIDIEHLKKLRNKTLLELSRLNRLYESLK